MDLTSRFDEFYDEHASKEQKDLSVNIGKDRNSERSRLLNNIYLRENCKFIFENACTIFNTGCAETLVEYLLEGLLTIDNPESYLSKGKFDIKSYFTFYELVRRQLCACTTHYFAKMSLATAFADVLSLMGTQYMNGTSCNLVDFNLMVHLFILKTQVLKNLTSVWNGVDVSKCEDYSASTKVGFRIFKYQYKAQIVNEIKAFMRFAVNSLTIKDSTIPNRCSLGFLDNYAVDMIGQDYVFSNGTSVVKPDKDDLKKHNMKLLNVFEGAVKPNASAPNINIYLFCPTSYQYFVTKSLASYFNMSFSEMNRILEHITDWENRDDLFSKLTRVVRGFERENTTEEDKVNKITRILDNAEKKMYTILDTELLKYSSKYYIPTLQYVIYDWNSDLFKPSVCDVSIDYQVVKEKVSKDEVVDFLRELYNSAQKINLLKKKLVKVKDDEFFKVNVLNVERDKVKEVLLMLKEETRALKSYWTENFSYSVTLYNEDFLEQAFINSKTNYNKDVRDFYKKKYSKFKVKNYEKVDGVNFPSGRYIKHNRFESIAQKSDDYLNMRQLKKEVKNEMDIERAFIDYDEEDIE